MDKYVYCVELPLAGREPAVFELCKADTPERACEVVRMLLETDKSQPLITIRTQPAPTSS
jgi:hypothetical protein